MLSCRCCHVGRERLWRWLHLAVSPCFHGSLAFLHWHFPPCSPSHPLQPSLCSQQQPPLWYCTTVPKLQLPAAAPSRGPAPLQRMYGCGKYCLILILFMLPRISCFTLSLKCFSSDSDNSPDVGIRPNASIPPPSKGRPRLLTLLFFPLVPSSYQVLPGSIYSFPLVR